MITQTKHPTLYIDDARPGRSVPSVRELFERRLDRVLAAGVPDPQLAALDNGAFFCRKLAEIE